MADERRGDQPQPKLPEFSAGGPYLATAVLCEKVLKEADGVCSLIRIVDRIVVSIPGPHSPAEMPSTPPVFLTLVLGFKSGFAHGPYTVRVKLVKPSHEVLNTFEVPMLLEGEDRGAQVALQFAFPVAEEGLYWFDVYLLDVLFTRVPLRIVYSRVSMS